MLSKFLDNRQDTRRTGEERRTDETSDQQQERRANDRRQDGDRRRWTCGILFKAAEAGAVIENWLDKTCQGNWGFELDEIDVDQHTKSFKVMFEEEADKLSFVEHFRK